MSTPTQGPPSLPQTRSTRSRLVIRRPTRAGAGADTKRAESSKRLASSLTASVVIHLLLLFVLSWIYFDLSHSKLLESILVFSGTVQPGDESIVDFGGADGALLDVGDGAAAEEPIKLLDEIGQAAPEETELDLTPGINLKAIEQDAASNSKLAAAKSTASPKSGSTGRVGSRKGSAAGREVAGGGGQGQGVGQGEGMHEDHFAGRKGLAKGMLLKRMGGTDASEVAVAKGLQWLKNHQFPDGSWNFYHLFHPRCNCTQPGALQANTNAATAMALLAFLGAGQTHEDGEYQQEVKNGLDYLIAHGTPAGKGICYYGELGGPQTYYTHGLATIALSEAHAMTSDPKLRPAVTGAVEFLAATQESGGGWRYSPGQPGDTSVVAWQLMALKSAQFSRITVSPRVFGGIDRFMHSVSSMRGSQYSYLPDRKDNPTASMTAAGLLCRMYLDWKDNGGLQAGIRFLDQHGPEPEGMYYNYYATQVMHHWGGPEWERWNNVMRDHLINTQIQLGHGAGSWDVADRHGMVGGRLYMTTLALLTLEVYYRHLPLYQKERIEMPLLKEPNELPNAKVR